MGRPDKKQPQKGITKNYSGKGTLKPIHGYVLPSTIITYTRPPTNWPSDMPVGRFLSTNQLSPLLTSEQLLQFHPSTLPDSIGSDVLLSIPSLTQYIPFSNPLVQIQQITSPEHPAYKQNGLFAAKALLPGTHIVDYNGLAHSCPLATCSTSDYDLAFLDRDSSLAIDSSIMGNEGRFVNDYHGIREDGPNAVFEEYFVKVKQKGKDVWEARMGIWVKSVDSKKRHDKQGGNLNDIGIKKGEEICVSYGKGWWRARQS